jgi:hypothetical protein
MNTPVHQPSITPATSRPSPSIKGGLSPLYPLCERHSHTGLESPFVCLSHMLMDREGIGYIRESPPALGYPTEKSYAAFPLSHWTPANASCG